MTPTEAAAWLRHGQKGLDGFLATYDRGMRPPLYPVDVEAIRTLVELAEQSGEWWIGRADGELMAGEYLWSGGDTGAEPDWTPAEEEWNDDPTEYVARRMVQVDEHRRTFGGPEPDDVDPA